MNVYFSHGKESGPKGAKIEALAAVARLKGFHVESPDYSKKSDPDARVEQLLSLRLPVLDLTVLVGSSMGGYVATVASRIMSPVGLFLLAPAFYLPGYKEQNPVPYAKKTVIIHGLNDEVVPVGNSIRFALEHSAELHLVDSDHRLNSQLPMIEMLFDKFLDDVLELSDVAKTVTWEKIAQSFGQDDPWVAGIWGKMAEAGHADYRTESERRKVLLRFIALTDFYYSFLSIFSREHWGCGPEQTADTVHLPRVFLDDLLTDFAARQGDESIAKPTIQSALEEIALEYVYPIILDYYGSLERIAASIYSASYPTYYDEEGTNEYLTDPEDLGDEEIAQKAAFQNICGWLEETLVQQLRLKI